MEKNATKIERDFDTLYSCIYMKQFIGEEFSAKIVSVTSFGIFVRLENTIEGFVGFESMPGDYYMYNESTRTVVGKRTSKQFKIGDEIKVRLIKSDVLTKQIDFEMI